MKTPRLLLCALCALLFTSCSTLTEQQRDAAFQLGLNIATNAANRAVPPLPQK